MAIDKDKILDEVMALAKPELERRADEIRERFKIQFQDYMDGSNLDSLDDLMKRAAQYEIKAVMESDPIKARQYAEAASDVLRQVSLVLVAERVVASKEVAALIQAAALSVWDGFKTVGGAILGVVVQGVVKGAVAGLLGGGGGDVADGAADFLGGLGQ